MVKKQREPLTPDQKLDVIIHHLENMDRRDRLRLRGSMFNGLIRLVSLGFFAYSIWFAYHNADEFISKITAEAAKHVTDSASDSAGSIIDKLTPSQLNSLLDKMNGSLQRGQE